MRFLLLFVAGLLIALGAEAAMKAGPTVMPGGNHHRLRVPSAAGPPLDGFTAPSGAYGFRKLRTAYAGNALRIRRASDNAEIDIGFLAATGFTGAPWDEAAAAAHCAATNCFVRTWYDQSGAGRDLGQATAANQPALVLGCLNFLACLQTTAGTQTLSSAATITPATGLVSFSVVAQRAVGTTGLAPLIRENGVQRLQTGSSANTWSLGPAPTFSVPAADVVWHAAAAYAHPTALQSLLNIDGVEASGTSVPTTAAGVTAVVGVAATTVKEVEAIFWDDYALTPGERTVLINNQRSFWGF